MLTLAASGTIAADADVGSVLTSSNDLYYNVSIDAGAIVKVSNSRIC